MKETMEKIKEKIVKREREDLSWKEKIQAWEVNKTRREIQKKIQRK